MERRLEMEMKNNQDGTDSPERRVPSIACDFDGVINSYVSEWSADELPDPPVPGAIEWLEEITKTCKVIIHSTRVGDGHIPLIRAWLLDHGLSMEAIGRLYWIDKPRATVYLDDRAIRFRGKNFPTEQQLREHRTWSEKLAAFGAAYGNREKVTTGVPEVDKELEKGMEPSSSQ